MTREQKGSRHAVASLWRGASSSWSVFVDGEPMGLGYYLEERRMTWQEAFQNVCGMAAMAFMFWVVFK